jgi:DNA-binding response OmpR family regulator
LCEQREGQFDLLVSDVVMPQMSGPQLAGKVRQLCPAIRTLFLSGYPNDELAAHGLPAGTAFLQKPFKPRDLAAKVREVLDRGDV